MSYLVLARKWRPQSFEDLIGQEPIVRILRNSIAQEKIAHAYVFSGPRGVGKTSTARILAKGLNCVEGPTAEPCGRCDACRSVAGGSAVDVIEIDGASNTGVDNIRDLRERVKYAPSGGKFKVYIIDEAHMLSTGAFNALLKTLEEPPPHVVFVLATTEARKIPLTVMSRCQHLPFRRIPLAAIKERLSLIVEREGIEITDQALGFIARAADGSIRDSLTILDQVASFATGIGEEEVKALLDVADFEALSVMARSVLSGDRGRILESVGELVDRGTDLRTFTKDLIKFVRDLLVVRVLGESEDVLDVGEEEFAALKELAGSVPEEYLILVLSELIKAEYDVKSAFSPRVALEMSLIKMSFLGTMSAVGDALAALADVPFPDAGGPDLPAPPTCKAGMPEADAAADEPAEEVRASRDRDTFAAAVETESSGGPTSGEESPRPGTGEKLLSEIAKRIREPKLSSWLTMAQAALEGDTLILTFTGPEAAICVKPIRGESARIEQAASDIMGVPIKIEMHISRATEVSRKELKKKVLEDPVVKEALNLFEGSIVDVKPTET